MFENRFLAISKEPGGYRTLRRRTVRRYNFSNRVDGMAESHDTHNTDNIDGAVELDTVSVIN